MSTGTLIAVIVAVVVVLIIVAAAVGMLVRRRRLRRDFGDEYDRVVEEQGGRAAADSELRQRQRRHDELELRELSPEVRQRYADEWRGVQERFVDRPEGAVGEADTLVIRLMRERGYPTDGYEQQVQDLSVEHSRTLQHYRTAHAVNQRSQGGGATTEELRGAMVHYRALFDDLLGSGATGGASLRDRE
ncbi:hypothetical protein [Streptomyces sp. NRRL S-87]|uniref:hypothetical protein n=1 Tax=Streptomyces sp. NRRL S-87 TaxID=1463920 RepID=UPI0004C2AA6A|nr:hypothetical protein [Streptomyces sp. NRRL S-87]